jgi:hypothetical protein
MIVPIIESCGCFNEVDIENPGLHIKTPTGFHHQKRLSQYVNAGLNTKVVHTRVYLHEGFYQKFKSDEALDSWMKEKAPFVFSYGQREVIPKSICPLHDVAVRPWLTHEPK